MFKKTKDVSQKQYVWQVVEYFATDKEIFLERVYYRAISKVASGAVNVDIEIMDFSDVIFKVAREEDNENFFELAFGLRKIAQRIFGRFGLTNDDRFLRLIA
jgi:hypothetical protein